MTTETRRALLVGGIIAALLVAALIVGFVVLRGPDGTPNSSNSPSPQPTEAHAQVEGAYLRFWDAWAKANVELDASPLDDVMEGEALSQSTALIEEAKSKNEPLRVQVEHDYRITITGDSTASVDDNFVDRSVRLDPETLQPVGPPANKTIRNSYTLRKVEGRWKVAEIIGYRSPSP